MNHRELGRPAEVVLLVEGDGRALRPYMTRDPTLHTIIERCHIAPGQVTERHWFHQHGERALTGQRIFREAPTPTPPEPTEHPLYDETKIRLVK